MKAKLIYKKSNSKVSSIPTNLELCGTHYISITSEQDVYHP